MKNNTLLRKMDTRTKEIAKQHLDNLEKDIVRLIENGILSILGLEKDRWGDGRINIDHCNGRMNLLSEYIQKTGCETAKKLVEEIKFTEEDKKKILASCKKELDYKMKKYITEKCEGIIEAKIDEILNPYLKEKEDDIRTEIQKSIGLIENIVEK